MLLNKQIKASESTTLFCGTWCEVREKVNPLSVTDTPIAVFGIRGVMCMSRLIEKVFAMFRDTPWLFGSTRLPPSLKDAGIRGGWGTCEGSVKRYLHLLGTHHGCASSQKTLTEKGLGMNK